MKIAKCIALGAFMIFGVFMIVFGEHDDSPGAQLLGVLAVFGGGFGIFRLTRKS